MSIENEIIEKLIQERAQTPADLERIKKIVAKKYKTSFPTNVNLLKVYHKRKKKDEKLLSLLKTRPVRSLSGVVNISVLTKPFPCPGKCIYCPQEKDVPKSYLTNEPAVMRAVLSKYDPFTQVKMRLDSLYRTGHPTSKIELRIVGATWSYYKESYREWFVKRCFDACNKKVSKTLKEAHKKNESAKHRLVCLSVETRPDFINKKEIESLREYGITMVELGVQSLSDDVLSFTNRGHKVKETIEATKLLKNAGFKVCYQVMLNLPKSSLEEDIKTFQRLFSDSLFRPDFLKIYPCLVLEGTPLYDLFKKGEHHVFNDKELKDVIIRIKKDIIPRYTRIQRLFRDIPVQSIAGGCKISNLREKIKEDEIINNWRCKCIRCREVKEDYKKDENLYLFREDYDSSDGKEVFLSFENKEKSKLYALLRLRITSESTFSVLKNSAIIREIRTYGQHTPVKGKSDNSPQHKGFGKKLIKEAEKISQEEFKKNKISVIAGVGTRDYWRKQGYRLNKTYMTKNL
jgi:elongator complex protein 3